MMQAYKAGKERNQNHDGDNVNPNEPHGSLQCGY